MTEIYLGKPPAYVEAWMKTNYKAEKWVPAVYTDKWLFSDGKTNDSDGYGVYVTYMDGPSGSGDYIVIGSPDGAFVDCKVDGSNRFINQSNSMVDDCSKVIEISDPGDSTGYRVYTPGHWEDADGNWINGSWEPEDDTDTIYSMVGSAYWVEKGGSLSNGGIANESGWYMAGAELVSNDRNANIISKKMDDEMTFAWRRTWMNTKPAPNA